MLSYSFFTPDTFSNQNKSAQIIIPDQFKETLQIGFHNNSNDWVSIQGFKINKNKLYHDCDALVKDIISNSTSSENMVFSIWKYLIHNTYGHPSAHPGSEPHDPIKFIFCYGYGYCDDYATVMYSLCKKIDLPARIWSLRGHVISEVYYNNNWHIFDAAYASIYRTPEGQIASLADIEKNPDLLDAAEHPEEPYPLYRLNLDIEQLKKIYSDHQTNKNLTASYASFLKDDHTINIILRPGEKISFDYNNKKVVYRSSESPHLPPFYANGTLKYDPFTNIHSINWLIQNNPNISWCKETLTINMLTESPNTILEIPFISSFPILRGEMYLSLHILYGKFEIQASTDHQSWQTITTCIPGDYSNHPINFSGIFCNFKGTDPNDQFIWNENNTLFQVGMPNYSFYIRFYSDNGAAILSQFNIESTFQFAPLSMPKLYKDINDIYLDIEGSGHIKMSAIVAQSINNKSLHNTGNKPIYNLLDVGEQYFANGDIQNAINIFHHYYKLNPDCPQALNNIGASLYHTGNSNLAIQYFQKAYSINPADEITALNYIDALIATSQKDKAMEIGQSHLEINPNNQQVIRLLSQLE